MPLFLTMFLGAFNDNIFRTALVTYVTFRATGISDATKTLLVSLAVGLFMLPYFIFSATSGQLADKYNKAVLIRWTKLAEIGIMIGVAIGFLSGHVLALIGLLFLMGAHSTFFGPAKYSILPDHLKEDELLGGNGLIEAGTFLAILLGTLVGGLLMANDKYGAELTALCVLTVAGAGYLASRFIPDSPRAAPDLKVDFNFITSTVKLVREARKDKNLFQVILLISWFWLIGAAFLAQLPNLANEYFKLSETGLTMLMMVFSFGVGVGSLITNALLKSHISTKLVPVAALVLTLFIYRFSHVDLSYFQDLHKIGAWDFITSLMGIRIAFDLFVVAVAGGVYIVPLYALLQAESDPAKRSQVIATNNLMNALFMVVASALAAGLLSMGLSIMHFFKLLAVMNGAVTLYLIVKMPEALLRTFFKTLLKAAYTVEIQGIEHYKAAGSKVVIVSNHISFLDAAILAAFLPDKVTFAINTHIAHRWWVRPFLSIVDAVPMDPAHPMSTRKLIQHVKKNHRLVIFPEGRISTTGALMKIYEGPGMIADKADAMLLPIRIEGAQYTPFSRLRGKVRIHWFRRVKVTILEPRKFKVETDFKGRKRRLYIGNMLYDIMSEAIYQSSDKQVNLFRSVVEAMHLHGTNKIIAEDIEKHPMTYRQLIIRALVLGRAMGKRTERGENVGVLLPNALPTLVTFFGLLAYARVPVMLNFSTGARNVAQAARTAKLREVYTSRKFLAAARLEEMAAFLAEAGCNIVYLEDVRKQIGLSAKLIGLWRYTTRLGVILNRLAPPETPATILFTSGSEGAPKGVALSHANIQANRYQAASRIDFGPSDIVFNALPMFHSFGLSIGTLLPLLSGIRVFFYPSPLHYRIVPEMVYDTNATILFGTDTFISGYAKFAHPYDFYSVRYVLTGAEKLKEKTRKLWADRFGIRVLEGYGVTETAPAIAANTPMQSKPGSVGRILPGMEVRIDPVEGITEGGRLFLKGQNIMLGYLYLDNPGVIVPPVEGWHDTGDIVRIDKEGYLHILGRAKRFAKIGGEMVSLAAIEEMAGHLWPGRMHAAIALPDERKGEQIFLATDFAEATRADFMAYAKKHGAGELFIPKKIVKIDALPLLGTGKIDYVSLNQMTAEYGTSANTGKDDPAD